MVARSIASLSITFGLVSIPVKIYSATESAAAIRFRLMAPSGARVRQQYLADDDPLPTVSEPEPAAPSRQTRSSSTATAAQGPALASGSERVVELPTAARRIEPPALVERSGMLKGYEFEKGRFVLFTADELKALEQESRPTIDIVAFIPERAVDPLYYDKPYFLAPDKRGAKPYSLLLRAMQDSGRCALAKWAWRSREHVVQIRSGDGGLVLQQLLYADEVRSLRDLDNELVPVGDAELDLAKRIIEQIAADTYDPSAFVDEEKQRILDAVERKIAGQQIVSHAPPAARAGAEVVDLMAALRASLDPSRRPAAKASRAAGPGTPPAGAIDARKPARRAARAAEPAPAAAGKRKAKR